MDTHGSNKELLAGAQVALTNLAATEEARSIIRNIDGVATVFRQLEAYIDVLPFVQASLSVTSTLEHTHTHTHTYTHTHAPRARTLKHMRTSNVLRAHFARRFDCFLLCNLRCLCGLLSCRNAYQLSSASPSTMPCPHRQAICNCKPVFCLELNVQNVC